MCAVCIILGWDRPPPPVQLELPLHGEDGQHLDCHCGTPLEPGGDGWRWCPNCRAAVSCACDGQDALFTL